MKKFTSTVAIVLAVSGICLIVSACGGNMEGWPTLELNWEIETYDEVSLEYNQLPYGRSDSETHFYGSSTDKDVINGLYCAVNGRLYSEKTYKKINTEEFRENVIIKFTKDGEEFVFQFYSYGVTNGYFIFHNGEIHKYHGDFVSGTYGKFKDKLS